MEQRLFFVRVRGQGSFPGVGVGGAEGGDFLVFLVLELRELQGKGVGSGLFMGEERGDGEVGVRGVSVEEGKMTEARGEVDFEGVVRGGAEGKGEVGELFKSGGLYDGEGARGR